MEPKRNQDTRNEPTPTSTSQRWASRGKMVLGAAGLFLFIVGVKRSFRDSRTDATDQPDPAPPTL